MRQAALGFIFLTVFLDVLSAGVTIPVAPSIIGGFAGDHASTTFYVGAFNTCWALMQFIFAPILGSLSDRYGRRTVLLISCFGLGLDYILMAMAPSLLVLFIGRIISGITAASFSTAGAYVADITPPEKRAASYGIFGMAFGFGFVIGPAFGGLLGDIDIRLPFWVAAGLTLLNAFYGLLILPESLKKENRRPFSLARANPIGSLQLLMSRPGLLLMACVSFVYLLAHQVLTNVFVLCTQRRYGWDISVVGYTLAAVGTCSIIVQGGLVRPLVKKFGERRMLLFATVAGCLGYGWFGFAPTSTWMWIGIPILAGMGFFMPSWQGLMTRRVGPSEQGQLQGTNGSLTGIAGMIGPSLFTSILYAVDDAGDPTWKIGLPFVTASAMMCLCFCIALVATKEMAKPVS